MTRALKTTTPPNPHIGSDFEDFLRDEGRLEIATNLAIKRLIAWKFGQTLKSAPAFQSQ